MKTLSIVTPCYNEEGGIAACYAAVRRVMQTELAAYAYEHIFIDNSSNDRTVEILRDLAACDPSVRLILNARNFGPDRSPYHAMLQAGGDAVIPVLADLQTPPDRVPEMVRLWEAGSKVVIAVRRRSAESALSQAMRSGFYRVMAAVSKVEQVRNFIGFGLYDRQVMDVFRSLNEPEPYFRGLLSEIGFERAVITYDQPPRLTGKSSYRFFDLLDTAILAITSFSRAPLRLMTLGGLVVGGGSMLMGMAYLIAKLLFWRSLPVGMAPVLISVFFLGAVQIFALGVVGEYVGLLLSYTRRFPLVVEKERVNCPAAVTSSLAPSQSAASPVSPDVEKALDDLRVRASRLAGDLAEASAPKPGIAEQRKTA